MKIYYFSSNGWGEYTNITAMQMSVDAEFRIDSHMPQMYNERKYRMHVRVGNRNVRVNCKQ